jgi:hypothetical protein
VKHNIFLIYFVWLVWTYSVIIIHLDCCLNIIRNFKVLPPLCSCFQKTWSKINGLFKLNGVIWKISFLPSYDNLTIISIICWCIIVLLCELFGHLV